jgi:hypothetical protein
MREKKKKRKKEKKAEGTKREMERIISRSHQILRNCSPVLKTAVNTSLEFEDDVLDRFVDINLAFIQRL